MNLSDPIFHDEEAARAYLETQRWPDGPICPWCGLGDRVKPLGGKSMGPGWYNCAGCCDKFTVRVGSIFERSHVPLRKWLLAFRLMCGSKKGVSAHQLHRTLEVTYKTAWFMAHRIREAMREQHTQTLGGPDKIVEADETFIGRSPKRQKYSGSGGYAHKIAVVSLVERGGPIRSFKMHGPPTAHEIKSAIRDHVAPDSRLMTDGAQYYKGVMPRHESVDHSKHEYVRGEAHTNTLEGFFSVFKRGMVGVYQHLGGIPPNT